LTAGFVIRGARPADIESIYLIETESFSNPWTLDNYTSEFAIPFSYMMVAERDGNIEGFALVWFVNDETHLNKIAVKSEFRRSGVAGAILDHIISKSVNEGKKVIFLEVREKNTAARNMYSKFGFIENGLRKNYYPDDNAVLIEKRL
jgi:[ribosomal protein S18]-alanine N-acetyltransferase